MRLLFLPRYSSRGASSRYRIWQYIPHFERARHEIEVHPLLDDDYLEDLYVHKRRRWRHIILGYGRRIFDCLSIRRFDAVICEQEILPFLPESFDVSIQRLSARFFVDYDDDAHAKYSSWPLFRGRIAGIMKAAETVVVGNDHLGDYARQFNSRVRVIPTVVDLRSYPDSAIRRSSTIIRIAWIGTPITANLLKLVLPVCLRLQSIHPNLSFRLIGAGNNFAAQGLRAEIPAWSEQTEVALLSSCDIGMMPLPDTEFTRSKCGLKLLQYMACGLPVVASPVGVNRQIVEDGRNGFLASSEEEWFKRMDELIRNPLLREHFGKAGRAKVAASYTVDHGFSKWQEILQDKAT